MADDYGIGLTPSPALVAQRAGVAAEGQDADAAAKAYEIAPRVGLPASIVQYNVPNFQRNLTRDNDYGVMQGNPQIQQFIADDPQRAAVAKGAYQDLDNISKAIDPADSLAAEMGVVDVSPLVGPTAEALTGGVAKGWQERQLGYLAYKSMMGKEGLEPAMQAYERQIGAHDEHSGFNHLVGALGGLAGNLGASAAASWASMAGGAAVGAVAGPVGAAAGAGAGLTAGLLADQFQSQAGSFYRESAKITDRNGQPIPEPVRKAAALAFGSASTALMGAGGAAMHVGMGAVMKDAALRALAEPGVINSLYRGITKTALGSMEFGAINAGMEASNIAATEFAKAASGTDFDTVINNPELREKATQQIADALKNGLILGGVLPSTPFGTNYLRDRIGVAQARFEANQREQIHAAVQDSELYKRSPQLVADFLQQHEGLGDVRIPAEEVAKRQDEFAFVPDLQNQLKNQLPLGGDVVVPAADYYSRVDPETGKALNDKIRGESGITIEEADAHEVAPPDYATVYHGSPHSFESFDIGKIGTGEGAQAYGHGLYFAERRGIAEDYRDSLSQGTGYTYKIDDKYYTNVDPESDAVVALMNATGMGEYGTLKVTEKDLAAYKKELETDFGVGDPNVETNLAVARKLLGKTIGVEEPEGGHLYQAKILRGKHEFLDYDTPLSEQPQIVEMLNKSGWDWGEEANTPKKGGDFIAEFGRVFRPENVSKKLADAGIAGIKYRDASSRDDRGMIDLWQKAVDEATEGLKEAEKQNDDVGATVERQALEHAQKKLAEEKEAYENPTRNYVVFNDKDVLITHKNDVARQIEEALERTTEQIMAGMNLQPAGKVAKPDKLSFLSSVMESQTTGLPRRTFDQLAKRVQDVQREITQKAYDIAYRELKRREMPLWKNELALETARAREDLEKRPDIRAYWALTLPKDDPRSLSLNRNEVDGLYNRESPSDYAAFQKGTRASESFPDKMFREDGLRPDEAAELLGFSSGKELLNSLREYERAVRDSGGTERTYREGLVKQEGLRRTEEKDNLNERISAEAIDMALSVKQVDVLIAEMHALVPGETKLTRSAVEEAAERNFESFNATEVKSKDFENQVAKWGREAFRFSNADKPVDALKALQKQLGNFLMAREARVFERERAKVEKVISRYQKNDHLEGVSQDFTDRIHSILADVDQNIPVAMQDLTERIGNKSLIQFISEQREKGLDIADTDWLHAPGGPKKLEHLTVQEYRQLGDTLLSLDKMGRQDRQIVLGDRQLDLDIVKERLVRYLKGVTYDRGRIIDGEATGAWNNVKMVGRKMDAMVREPQYMIKRIDNNDPLGPWSQDIYRPLYDQENAKRDELNQIATNIAKLYDKEWSSKSKELVTNNFRDLNGKPMQIDNGMKLMMLLNSGNDRNMRLLAHTLSEDVDTVRDWLKQNITEKDLQIAHGVLEEFDRLWPKLRDMTERVSGISPPKVRGRGYDTPVGRFEGGYFPAMADANFLDLGGKQPDLFDRRIFDPATDSRAAHERTGKLYALTFDLNRLPYIVRQTVHDIYLREPVESAQRLLGDRELRTAFTDAFGPEYTRQLTPWLQYIANDGAVPTHDGLWDAYNWSRMARQNAVSVLVGGRISTAMIHGLSAASQSITEAGFLPFLQESAKLMLRTRENERTAWDNAFMLSSSIRNRMHNIYTSLEAEVPKMLDSDNARAEYQAFSTRLIAYLDQLSAVVVFNAKMKQALAEGHSTDEAIWIANRSVDIAHGSNTIVNRPAVMRGGEGSKWFTQFMGFFNNTYNRTRDIGVSISKGDYMQAMIGSLGFLAATAMVHTVVRYNQKEDWKKQLAESAGDVMVGGIPVLRDAFRGIMHEGDYGESMITTATKGITQPIADYGKILTGHTPSKDWVAHLAMAPGFGMGFIPGISGLGPKVLTGHLGDWLTLATTKAGAGHVQFIWDKAVRHSLEPPDIRRGVLEGNWHQRKAK